MDEILPVGQSKNVLVTHAVGGTYFDDWSKYSSPTWIDYCKRHDLGLYVFNEKISTTKGKKLHWQKLHIGTYLESIGLDIENVCYLDTDVIINPAAPNIFNEYNPQLIGLISQINNIPYDLEAVLRRVAFLRHSYFSDRYPLDSSLFLPLDPERLYREHELPPVKDIACTGVFIFNIRNHGGKLAEWSDYYGHNIETLDGGTEQIHLNHHIISNDLAQWLDYKWQTLWMYEMAWCHPHLYASKNSDKRVITACIEATLFNSYFLHFAGAWEGSMWEKCDGLFELIEKEKYIEFMNYSRTVLSGDPQGICKPSKNEI